METTTFAALAESIRSRGHGPDSAGDDRRCLVVGVDGWSGAGKTSFAGALAAALSVPCIGTDELVPGWDGLGASLDTLVDSVLAPLARGEAGRWRRYDWVEHQLADWADLPPCELVVVEGCCVGVPPVADYLSVLVWIDTPEDERVARLAQRDDWEAYAPHVEQWRVQEQALRAGSDTEGRADLVVDNSDAAGDGLTAGLIVCR